MLPLVAAVLLAASPRPSLLAPDSGLHLSARLLVAQDTLPEAPTPPPVGLDVDGVDREERIRELTRQVGLLSDEIRAIDVSWPTGSMLMAFSGYLFAPMLLLGIPVLVLGLGDLSEAGGPGLLGVGIGMMLAGGGGVGLLVGGTISGIRRSSANRERRDALIRERTLLEDELRDLKARDAARGALQVRRWTPRPTVPLLAVRF